MAKAGLYASLWNRQRQAEKAREEKPELRVEHVVESKHEICTLDLNTMWFGGGAMAV